MSDHNVIVVSGEPRGHFVEGTLASGVTVKPGQCVTPKAGAALLDGRPQYELYNGSADGARRSYVVVRENDLMGKGLDDAYSAGSRFFGYIPLNGDEIQVVVADIEGTADGVALADLLMLDDGTGKVLTATSAAVAQFEALETLTAMAADTRCLVRCLSP